METVAIAYVPVLHKGYLDFLHALEARRVTDLYLIGDSVLEQHEALDYINRKERLRALSVATLKEALSACTSLSVHELTDEHISTIRRAKNRIVTPKEDIGRVVIDAYFSDHEIEWTPVFLRWNRENADVNQEPEAASIAASEFQRKIFALMREEAEKSFDWWRQVGSALIKGDEIICVTHNEHMPEAQTPNIEGDVRSLFKRGININYSTAAHAEVIAIAGAAKAGIQTEGAELYLTDFPCPYCARLIATAGIATVFFSKGYAVLEGDTFLKQAGVDIVRVRE